MSRSSTARTEAPRAREARLGFRADAKTKHLVERAAQLERRSLTDFCVTALIEAAQKTVARHESLSLSTVDRTAFFDALVAPRAPNARLRRALRAERARVKP